MAYIMLDSEIMKIMSDSDLGVAVKKNQDGIQTLELKLKELKSKETDVKGQLETLDCERLMLNQELNNRKAGTSTGGAKKEGKKAPNVGSATSVTATATDQQGSSKTASASSHGAGVPIITHGTGAPIISQQYSSNNTNVQATNSSVTMSDSEKEDSSDGLQSPVPDPLAPSYDDLMQNR